MDNQLLTLPPGATNNESGAGQRGQYYQHCTVSQNTAASVLPSLPFAPQKQHWQENEPMCKTHLKRSVHVVSG